MGTILNSITEEAAVMGTNYCVRGRNKDDFLSPCSSLVCRGQSDGDGQSDGEMKVLSVIE